MILHLVGTQLIWSAHISIAGLLDASMNMSISNQNIACTSTYLSCILSEDFMYVFLRLQSM
jgi:hypothetical protein